MMTDLMKLQNGSDIYGIAVTSDGSEPPLREETAGSIGGAFAYWLGFSCGKNPYDLRICVGHDPRATADGLKRGLLKGMAMFGAEGYDAGLSTTPAMFMSTVLPQFDFDGAVMITAGDMPQDMNGFKFFTKQGALGEGDVGSILARASRYNFIGDYYEERQANVLEMYAAYMRQMISLGLRAVPGGLSGMHVVVDAGNGTGGFFAAKVLEPMGADISGSFCLEPDGTFPDRRYGTENADAVSAVADAVRESKADLGILFDTDADRSVVVGPDGRPITRDRMIALAAALAAEDHPGGTVVTDDGTSDGLHAFLEEDLGLRHVMLRRDSGDVIRRAAELREAGEDAFLAAEISGLTAYSDNYFLDDGAFLAVQIVINAAVLKAQGRTINDLISGLK